jgi:hypothetical protein
MQTQPLLTAYLCFPPEVAHVALENRIYWETIITQPIGSVVVTLLTPLWKGLPTLHWPTGRSLKSWPP